MAIKENQNVIDSFSFSPGLVLTSYQLESEVLMYKAHKGSDLEKMSMSIRFSQEMVNSTLVAKCVGPGTGGPLEAMGR